LLNALVVVRWSVKQTITASVVAGMFALPVFKNMATFLMAHMDENLKNPLSQIVTKS